MTQIRRRLASVDAFRALTMLLMIFVNDLVSVKGVPEWLEHAGETEDRMGLADVVFPAFLFIVGLSIPFAIDRRAAKGEKKGASFVHILFRSVSLLIMGIYHVNYEEYNRHYGWMTMFFWLLWVTIGMFLVWLDYPPDMAGWLKKLLRICGITLLVSMAIVYRGANTSQYAFQMRAHWYGILGLIGWCYLICATLYLFIGERIGILSWIMGGFLTLCVLDRATGLHFFHPLRQWVWIVGSGSLPAITVMGVIASLIYRKGVAQETATRSLWLLCAIAVAMLLAGFAFRPFWGISKIRATPSWVLICTGISLICFSLLAYITDIKGYEKWYQPIRAAGTSTLTCYLLPYLHFAIVHMIGEQARLPEWMRTGGAGIIKCIVFSFLVIWTAGYMEKKKFRVAL